MAFRRPEDRSVAFRDVIDLGMLIRGFGGITAEAVAKAEAAYGEDIRDKVRWAVRTLEDRQPLAEAAEALQMPLDTARSAVDAVAAESARLWPPDAP